MILEHITQQLWRASEENKVCRVRLIGEASPRIIHPYGICRTATNKIVVVCWQESGFSAGGELPGFRNLILKKILNIDTLNKHFSVKEEFDPRDSQYVEWVYNI